jgi:hypothetical protein
VGRKLNVVSAVGILSILAMGSGFAQGKPKGQRPHQNFSNQSRQFNQLQPRNLQQSPQRFQLSPEERLTFKKNAERWLQMSPEERTLMRSREQARSERIKNEAETVLRESGLTLDQKKRDLFQERYLQERRRIDRELRQEYEARRQQQLEILKKEFGPPATLPSAGHICAVAFRVTQAITARAVRHALKQMSWRKFPPAH